MVRCFLEKEKGRIKRKFKIYCQSCKKTLLKGDCEFFWRDFGLESCKKEHILDFFSSLIKLHKMFPQLTKDELFYCWQREFFDKEKAEKWAKIILKHKKHKRKT